MEEKHLFGPNEPFILTLNVIIHACTRTALSCFRNHYRLKHSGTCEVSNLCGNAALPFPKKSKKNLDFFFFNVKLLTLKSSFPLARMKAGLNWLLNGKTNKQTISVPSKEC